MLQSLGATLQAGHDRVGVYLTNALTGWEPVTSKPLPFPELEDERKRADSVKQEVPILVILGNPPYNGFAGMAQELPEERGLSLAYRATKTVRPPEGQGLNDLYIRFFRMAERRIAEKTGRGIVSFISNYSWLDGLSFTGMRERYLEAFDAIRIDCLNGDKFKSGKITPEGLPDPSIFSTEHNREGIQVGTAIVTLIRKEAHIPTAVVSFRHLWGTAKRQELLNSAEEELAALYEPVTPSVELGLPFFQTDVCADYYQCPKLPEFLPSFFPGVKTSRDDFLVAIDRNVLEKRIDTYFDPAVSHEEMRSRFPTVMAVTGRFDPVKTRDELRKRGLLPGHIVQYAYRPFDVRWLYWEQETKLLDEKRSEYRLHTFPANIALVTQQRSRGEWFPCQAISCLGSLDLLDRGATIFPLMLSENNGTRPNLTQSVREFLEPRKIGHEAISHHTAAILHAPMYRHENSGALELDWPRIPIPNDAVRLRASSDLGKMHASKPLGCRNSCP